MHQFLYIPERGLYPTNIVLLFVVPIRFLPSSIRICCFVSQENLKYRNKNLMKHV